jgi:hypothetical protein
VYNAILELKERDPIRPINADFLKSVNKRCKSGISVNGVNCWWGRHQKKLREEKAGTSASPGVQKEKKGKLKRKAAQLASSEDGEDSGEQEGANGDSDDDRDPQVNRMVTRKERMQSELAVVENKLTVAKLANALAEVEKLKNELTKLKAAREATVRLKPRGDPHPQILILSLYHLPEVRNGTTAGRADHRVGWTQNHLEGTRRSTNEFDWCKGTVEPNFADPHPQILILTLYPFPNVRNVTTGERAGKREETAPSKSP